MTAILRRLPTAARAASAGMRAAAAREEVAARVGAAVPEPALAWVALEEMRAPVVWEEPAAPVGLPVVRGRPVAQGRPVHRATEAWF
jgi:hypothetical protein